MSSNGTIPKGWSEARLGIVLPLQYGKALREDNRDLSGCFTVYGSSGAVGKHSLALTKGPSIIVGRKGNVGAAYHSVDPCWPIDTVYFAESTPSTNLRFFYHLLIALNLVRLDRSTAVPGLSRDDYSPLQVPVPPAREQARIVEAIESHSTKVEVAVSALERVRTNLRRYRASVVKAAIEGRLVPREAELARKEGRDFEPASVLLDRILREGRRRWEESELARMTAAGKSPEDDRWKTKYKEPVGPDTRVLPQLPDGWCWTSLDQLLFTIEAGKNFRCIERPPRDDEVGVVKVSAVTWGTFDEEQSKTCPKQELANAAHLIREGDLLFSRANTVELVGACVIVRSVRKRLMLSDKILRLRSIGDVEEWILWYLRSRQGRKQIEALATGNQESMRNIGQDRIRRIRVALPPLAEMKSILASLSEKTSDADHWDNTAAANDHRLQRLRQSILKWAFEGKLVDQDPNDEPASVLLEGIRFERAAAKADSF